MKIMSTAFPLSAQVQLAETRSVVSSREASNSVLEPSDRLRVVHRERNNRPATKENIVGMKLKTCLASLAVLLATAAHAEGEGTDGSTEASAGQAVEHVAPDRHAADANRKAT